MLAAPESAGDATRGQVLKRHIPSKCPIERFVHLLHRHKWEEACRCCAKCCSNILQCDVGRVNAIHFAAVCFELSNGSNCHPKDEPSSSPLFEEDLIILLPNGIVLFSLQSNTNVRKTLQKNSCAKRFLDGCIIVTCCCWVLLMGHKSHQQEQPQPPSQGLPAGAGKARWAAMMMGK